MMHPQWILAYTFLLACQTISAQPVSFTAQSALLNPVSGFTQYPDCTVDMNGDLLDDVVRVGNLGFYIDYQQANGSFTQRFFLMPFITPPNWSICAGDIDNNGFNDLLLANNHAVSFVKANGNASAYAETVMPGDIVSQRSTLADINIDGWLDAFVCNDVAQSIPYRNDGTGMMTPDTNLIHTADRRGNYGAIWTDYDNDGDHDLYISKCVAGALPGDINRTNLLYRNNGDGTFSEVGAAAGVDDNAQSWCTSFEDFDNDGDFDAFIVNHDFQNRLFRNNGDGTFTNVSATLGYLANDVGALENAAADFNNDGFVDIFADLVSQLYLGHGDLSFTAQNAPVQTGAIADLNNDGFLDLYHDSQLWINDGNTNHWLKVIPVGLSSNRNGIGTRVEIYGAWGKQIREVRSGQSFSPMSSLVVHFGLGQNDHVDSLSVRWPSGVVTTLRHLAADQTYQVPEAPCLAAPVTVSILGNPSICPGDTIQLVAPGGFSNYRWSNNQVGQTLDVTEAGGYFVTLLDAAGCAALSQRVEIQTVKEVLPQIFAPAGNVTCQGDPLVLFASAGNNYAWSNGISDTSTIAVTENGIYTVAIDAVCSQEPLISAPFEVFVLPSAPPVVSDVLIGQGDSILLTAVGENCQWYDQPFGGHLLAAGPVLQTMPLNTSSTFYVESHQVYPGENQQGGKLNTTGADIIDIQGAHLLFEVWKPITLLSVSVFSTGGSSPTRLVQLFSADTMVAEKQFNLVTGWNVLELNFEVPVGKYILKCPQGRLLSNRGQLDYPYPIGDAGRITSSAFGEGYYFYFYNWMIKTHDVECVSDRVAVNVAVTSTKEQIIRPAFSVSPNPSEGIFTVDMSDNTPPPLFSRILDACGKEVFRDALANGHSFQLDLRQFPNGVYCLQVVGASYFETVQLIKL